jgi:glycosyltransferase involved in cell wall biosynthesis
MELPNLSDYRREFVEQGVSLPVSTVPFYPNGLLATLPPPPSNKTGWPWTIETPLIMDMMSNGKPWPKISIVTPSYNQGQFIEETIRSVLLQNYPNLEFIVFDGGSTDETKKILDKYKPWLSFYQSKEDRGQGHAINLGFSIASGDCFGWINSDDFYLPSCFRMIADRFEATSSEFIYGDSMILYENTQNIKYWQGNFVLDRYLRYGGLIASHAAFWKMSIHQPIWEKINCNIDGELWLRLVPKTIKSHVRYPLSVCRIQSQAKTSHERYIPLWKEDEININNVYGSTPRPRSLIYYEHLLLQLIYKKITSYTISRNIKFLLQQCYWQDMYQSDD